MALKGISVANINKFTLKISINFIPYQPKALAFQRNIKEAPNRVSENANRQVNPHQIACAYSARLLYE